jgi:predicted metalloprotease with PDZ domain
VEYRVSFPRLHAHLVDVEARFPAGGEVLDAVLPVWTPGSYLVREFARQVQEAAAFDDAGRPLPLSRPDKRTFRVAGAGGRPVTLRYRVYCNELSVRTSHVDGSHALLNGASVFLTADALRAAPHRVRVEAPDGWRVSTPLPAEADGGEGGGGGEVYVAADYDALVDAPIEVGPHARRSFRVLGVEHQLVVWGGELPGVEAFLEDLARVCAEAARLYGGLPLTRYLFLLYLTDRGRGGLEHRDGTVMLFPRALAATAKGREELLSLAAHEYFHLWHVKRVAPRALTPPDLSRENYTALLWAFEGGTAYYDTLLLRRAGLMRPERYLTRLGETLSQLQGTPGRRVQTLEDSSRLAWVKQYRPDEHSPNSAVSYYLKGEVVCVLLDLLVRRATRDARSLDDVLRLLLARHGEDGVPEGGVEAAAAEVAGADLAPFFHRALRTTEELDLSPFAHVGLEARLRPRSGTSDRGGTPPRAGREGREGDEASRGWSGLSFRGEATVSAVVDGSPAMEAGLYTDDEVVAVDGWRTDGAGLLARCEERAPGDVLRVTLFRRDRLLELPLPLGEKPHDAVWLARVERPTEAQKAAWEAWLGARWEDGEG